MKICIILVNYNGFKDTIDTIESILKNQCLNYTIVVIDNGSSNNEATLIKEKYKDVVAIRSDINLGFAGGNNIGIDYAVKNNYDYILLLNNDTVILGDMIQKLLEHVDSNTVCTPAMYYYDSPNELWYGGGKINKWTGNVNHLDSTEMRFVNFATGCCILIPRTVIENVGKLDEWYFMYVEDVDYSLRLLEHNIKICYVPSAKLYHKIGKSSGGNLSPLSVYYTTRNRIHLIRKYSDYFYCTALWFTILSRIFRMFQYYIKGTKSWIFFFKGIYDGIFENDKMIAGDV